MDVREYRLQERTNELTIASQRRQRRRSSQEGVPRGGSDGQAASTGVSGGAGLSAATCGRMLRSPGHVFQQMWAAHAWDVLRRGDRACWEVLRSRHAFATGRGSFICDVLAGATCRTTEWSATASARDTRPTREAPDEAAILGLDADLVRTCYAQSSRLNGTARRYSYVDACRAAGIHVLALRGAHTPYNLCRNFEWLACGASGRLSGLPRGRFVLATSPASLDLQSSPLGHCFGHVPGRGMRLPGGFGYTARDVYAFEVCTLSEICANREELFMPAGGQRPTYFTCNFTSQGLARMAEETIGMQPREYDQMPCRRKRPEAQAGLKLRLETAGPRPSAPRRSPKSELSFAAAARASTSALKLAPKPHKRFRPFLGSVPVTAPKLPIVYSTLQGLADAQRLARKAHVGLKGLRGETSSGRTHHHAENVQ